MKVPSNGQVNLNTVLGALGTAGFAGINLRNLVGGLFNQGTFNGMDLNTILGMLIPMLTQMGCNCQPTCSEDHLVTRYELETEQKLAAKDAEIALLKANTYNDQKSLELYKYIDGELRDIRSTLCAQAVTNQKTADSFALASADLAAVKNGLEAKIALEAERRCCADNAIVNYANATFYPKMVADVTVGTTTTAQTLYNPIPDCGCCGK